jgi:hypothetical protein
MYSIACLSNLYSDKDSFPKNDPPFCVQRKDKTFMVDHIVQQLSQIHFSSVENGTAAAKTPEIAYNIYVIYICTFLYSCGSVIFLTLSVLCTFFVLCTVRYLAERPRKVRGAYFQNTAVFFTYETLYISKTFTGFS